MGSIGKCCCVPDECIPCTEQADLTEWSIYEEIFGFTFNGSFGALDTVLCRKCGTQCQRQQTTEIGTPYTATSAWPSTWGLLLQCGPCADCTDPENPVLPEPCTEVIDPITGETTLNCPGTHPNYEVVESQTRNGFSVKFWFAKLARATVCVNYIGTNQVQFSVTADIKANITDTSSYATQRRYRRTVRQCDSNLVISQTVFNDVALALPTPLEPCYDILSVVSESVSMDSPTCPAWIGDAELDPCETATSVDVTIDPCLVFSSGICVELDGTVSIQTLSTRQCCDVGQICVLPQFTGIWGGAFYQSEIYDCDDVPANIPLTRIFDYGEVDTELAWECDAGVDTPDPIDISLPTSLTLTVA